MHQSNSFYSPAEINKLGLKKSGKKLLISRNSSIYSPELISIGNNVRIDDFCLLSGNISIGNNVHIAAYTAIYGSSEGVIISDFANIGSRVNIYAISDNFSGEMMTSPVIPDRFKSVIKKKVFIGQHVAIGPMSLVLPGSRLEEGCTFRAFSLITGETIPWTYYSGIPIRPKKERSRQLLLIASQYLEQQQSE